MTRPFPLGGAWLGLSCLLAGLPTPGAERIRYSGQKATLDIQEVDDIRVERISRSERLSLRQRGLRFHEVKDKHFGDKFAEGLRKKAEAASLFQREAAGSGDLAGDFALASDRRLASGEVPRQGARASDIKANARNAANANASSAAGYPPLSFSPTQISAMACVQFDLDLTLISGGAFPGLISVGLSGEVRQIPQTKCYGWNLELFLQISIGFDIGSLPFRITFVMISTLSVQEQPLDIASGELMWELPFGYDTSKCHTPDPFTLVETTLTEQWSFIASTILPSSGFAERAEKSLQDALKDYDANNGFEDYLDLLRSTKPWSGGTPPPPPEGEPDYQSTGSLVKDGKEGTVKILGSFVKSGAGSALMTFKADASLVIEQQERQSGIVWLRLVIWQDVGEAIMWKQLPKIKAPQATWRLHVKDGDGLVAQVQLLDGDERVKFAAPVHVDPHDWDPHLNVHIQPIFDDEAKAGADIKFAIMAGGNRFSPTHPGRLALEEIHANTALGCTGEEVLSEVQLKIGDDKAMMNTWTPKQFGKDFPWGVTVDLERPSATIPREAATVLRQEKPMLSTGNLDRSQTIALLDSLNSTEGCSKALTNQLTHLQIVLSAPNRHAFDVVETDLIINFIVEVLWQSRDYIKSERPEEIWHGEKKQLREFLEKLARNMKSKDLLKTQPTGPKSLTWEVFHGRSVNQDICTQFGRNALIHSMQDCKDKCIENRPLACKDSKCGAGVSACNAARLHRLDGGGTACSVWYCTSFDKGFPKDKDAYDLAVYDEEPDPDPVWEALSQLENVPAGKSEILRGAVSELDGEEQALMLDAVATLLPKKAKEVWKTEVRDATMGDSGPKEDALKHEALAHVLDECLFVDLSWARDSNITKPLRVHTHPQGKVVPMVVKVAVFKNGASKADVKQIHADFEADFFAVQQSSVSRKVKVMVTDVCPVEVRIKWIWSLRTRELYFRRPKLVPVAQAFFAAYDQFVTKLPGYSAQVAERLTAPQDSWWDWVTSGLPYATTDGRYLHRNMKSGVHDHLKIHEGDLIADDAVFNYPKALSTSRHSGEPAFLYNAGLSLANLFVRALGDIQAMFFLYFADHPDWDGDCNSLPAKFNLYYEQDAKGFPTHRAGAKVGEKGEELDEDERAAFLEWHWISMPFRFSTETQRAAFFKQTAPIHGKDMWATPDQSELGAEMWPHVWCELVEEYWVKDVRDVVRKSMEGGEAAAATSIRELLSNMLQESSLDSVVDGTISKPIVDSLREVEQELSESPPNCPSEHELEDEAAVREMVMHLGEGKWKELAGHQGKVLDLCRDTVAMLRKHVIKVSKKNEDKRVEKTSDEVDHQILALNSVEDNMHDIEIQWKDEQKLIDEMLNSTLATWAALKSSNDLDPAVAAVNMQAFKTARNKVELSLRRKKEKFAKMEQTLFKVLNDCQKAPFSAISEAEHKDYSKAYTYGKSLSSAVQLLQKRAVAQVQVLYACFNLHSRPDKLPADRFGAHFSEAAAHRDVTLMKLKDEIDPSTISGFDMDGIDFFFQDECQVPVDAEFDGSRAQVDETAEPRHECERVVLSKAFLTLLPSLSTRAVSTFKAMQTHLASLRRSPHRGLVNDMVLEVTRFLKTIDEGLDDDFFTAFAYIRDGSLYGDLWESLPQAATTIVATLEERTKTRRSWVEESISQKSRLTTGRRARIRKPEEEESEIPTAIDGCVCQETWSAWQWRSGLPRRVYLDGCSTVEDAEGSISGLPFDAAEVPGFCRAKQKKMSLVRCSETFARCDPKVTKDTRPTYSIWRAGHSNAFHRSQLVKLPLIQVDVFMNFDLRNFRGDYCTPNFAPLLIKYNYHYSAFSWTPWEVRRTNCLGARLHPPGVSLLLVRCQRGSGDTVSVEWELVGSAYLIAYYNTWGTADGDMMESWFTGSWGGNLMDKITGNGLAGVLKQSIWSGSGSGIADGYGYLMTDQVMQSGPSFWLATIAEVIGAYNLASLAVDKEDGQSVSMFAMVSAVATGVWKALQRYGAVPAKWGVDVSLSTVTKALETVSGVVLSPWRNEHDVLLSFKYSRHSYSHKRTAADMIDRLTTPQVRAVLDATAESGALVSEMTTSEWWRTYQQRPSHGPEEIANLGRDTMLDMIERWAQKEEIKHATQELFTSCKHRPRWYKVVGPGAFAFWSMKHSSWMQPAKDIGTEVMLMSQSDGWLREVNDESEEARFWPDGYQETRIIKLAAEVVKLPRSDDTTVRTLTKDEFHRVLQATNNKDLRCWAQRVSEIDKEAVMHARFRVMQNPKYASGIWGNVSTERASDRMLIPPEYFDSHYNREFLEEFWRALQKEANSTARKSLTSVFARGGGFTPRPSKDGGEKAWTVQSSTALGLSLMHRIGLSFIKIPGILQVQPYFQLKFDFNIKKLLSAISMRVRGANPNAPSSASVLEHYRKRQDKCMQCVRNKQAFCDRERPAESMLVGGRTDEMDECEDRTVARKTACRSFLWHNFSNQDSGPRPGKVFENQVCPCFDRVTGQPINPRWITSEEHCKEMRWPATDDEKDRRETKASDWQFGFLNQASGRTHNLLVMGDDIAFDGRKSCHEGFRCCGAKNHVGEETLRCVEEESLQRKGSWLFNNQKCKYFDPADFKGVRWSHIRDEFRCAPVDKHNSAFDGHWWVDSSAGSSWSKKAGLD